MSKPKIGLLPLYLKLYDDVAAETRPVVEEFVRTIASRLQAKGLDMIAAPVCRLKPEFEEAIVSFETAVTACPEIPQVQLRDHDVFIKTGYCGW